jgi:hypothetical protein
MQPYQLHFFIREEELKSKIYFSMFCFNQTIKLRDKFSGVYFCQLFSAW